MSYTTVHFLHNPTRHTVSVIIPVFQDADGLEDTLASLKYQTYEKSRYEIIVANDGADDDVSRVCKKFGVIEVRISPNKGSYNARNCALEVSRGEYIAFIDANMKAPPDWLENGTHHLYTYDYVGGNVQFFSAPRTAWECYESTVSFPNKQLFTELGFVPTANVFVRRSVIEHIGGFDRRLYSGGDFEFGQRVQQATQYTRAYCHDVVNYHPYRGFTEYQNRVNRIIKGQMVISRYFPRHSPRFTQPHTFSSIVRTLTAVPAKPSGSRSQVLIYIAFTKYFLLHDFLTRIYFKAYFRIKTFFVLQKSHSISYKL